MLCRVTTLRSRGRTATVDGNICTVAAGRKRGNEIDMEITQRIPLEQFSYIEFTKEYESIGVALAEHAKIIKQYEDPGLPVHEWAKVRNKMMQTGQFDPNIEGLSKAQRYFINEAKLAYRAAQAQDPVIV